MTTKREEMIKALLERNCKPIFIPDKKTEKIRYECKCGKILEKIFIDFMRRKTCKYCNSTKLKENPNENCKPEDTKDEKWILIEGGWLSNKGRAVNSLGKELILCKQKFRYRINGKNRYVSRLMAEAFKIEGYQKLSDPKYVVEHIDKNEANNNIENLRIISRSELCSNIGKKSRQSELFLEKLTWDSDRFSDLEYRIIDELPKYFRLYSNGEIWNGSRFLTFSKSEGYLSLYVKEKSYKVHRLICYAFHPVDGKNCLEDYKDLQVNHINGNRLDNSADNLEWYSGSQNIFNSYLTGLNNRRIPVVQLDRKTNEYIAKFPSITVASKETGEPEHRISLSINGKKSNVNLFKWCSADDKYYYLRDNDSKVISCIPFEKCNIVIIED